MATNDEDATGVPTRLIHQAYREALQARREYQQATGGPMEHAAHQQLHDAIAHYYEVLRPVLAGSNAAEDLWENEKLWPTEPVYRPVAVCPACGGHAYLDDEGDEDEHNVGELCPNCGKAVVETDRVPKVDESGQTVFRYATGLKSVGNIWDQRTEREIEYSDALGTHTETRVETQLVPPEHLKTIARKLDEALKQLDLHATVDDKLPKGKLSKPDP